VIRRGRGPLRTNPILMARSAIPVRVAAMPSACGPRRDARVVWAVPQMVHRPGVNSALLVQVAGYFVLADIIFL
jgi:hypothetical protein